MRRSSCACLLTLAVLAPIAGQALAGSADVRTVSGPSPFADCQDERSTVVQGAEVEPSLALDPRRPRHVIVVYQQDRFLDGAARGIVASSSSDGGRTWRRSVLPIGFCATGHPGPPFRLSDPWVSVGPDGLVYALASSFAMTSSDGGRTWAKPVSLAESSDRYLLDKGSLTADPAHPGVAYAVWARYLRPRRGAPVESDAMLTRTTDGGRTWSRPQVILPRGRGAGSISSVIVPDPARGRLYHFAFWQIGSVPTMRRPSRLIVQWSRDGGSTWSPAHTIGKALTVGERSHEAFSGRLIRTGFAVPSFALDPRRGTLYAAWQDARFSGGRRDQIVLARSRDGGETWSKPIRISRRSTQAFVPAVAVTRSGVVGVSFYETASASSQRPVATRYRLAISHDLGRSFARSTIGTGFDLARAPLMEAVPELAVPPGLFLGDYMGLEARGGTFHLAFVTTNRTPRNATDVRYAVVSTASR